MNDFRDAVSWKNRQTHAHTRNNSTFAVCFQLILPPTLHQLCPEQFFQPAATHSVDIIQTSAVSKPFITKSPKRKACLPLPLPHFYQFLVYCRPHLRVFAHDLSETEHKQQRRRFGFNNFLGMYKKTFYLASYQVDVTFCRAGSAGGTHCPFTEPYRVKRKSLTVPLWLRLICLKPTTPLLKKKPGQIGHVIITRMSYVSPTEKKTFIKDELKNYTSHERPGWSCPL